MVADMQDVIVVLESLYADALVDAGESFQRAEKNTTDGGGVKMMARENTDIPYKQYRELLNRKPLKDSTKYFRKVKDARIDQYRTLSEEDIPDIDFLEIAEYNKVNEGYVYTIRNYDKSNFAILNRRAIKTEYDGYVMEVASNGDTGETTGKGNDVKGPQHERHKTGDRVSGDQGAIRGDAGRSQKAKDHDQKRSSGDSSSNSGTGIRRSDREYLDAVNRGDQETAQRMVEEVARNAMPDSKLRMPDGNLRIVYHGTNTGDFIQSEYGDEAVAFDSSQIKSAEPVTYDDNGDVIPLSKRFDAQKNDIRYSDREKAVDNSTRKDENEIRGEEYDERRIQAGTTETARSDVKYSWGTVDGRGNQHDGRGSTRVKEWGKLSKKDREKFRKTLEAAIHDSPNYSEIRLYLAAVIGKPVFDMNLADRTMAVEKVAENIYSDITNKENSRAYVEDKWGLFGNIAPLIEAIFHENVMFSDRDPAAGRVNEVLEKENGKLKEDVQYLKELLKIQRSVTNGTKFTKTSVEAMASQLILKTEIYLAGGRILTCKMRPPLLLLTAVRKKKCRKRVLL